MLQKGIVYLVGAGPGNPGLFTLRGVEVLQRAEVVLYDGLVNRDLLRYAPKSAELIYGGKFDRNHSIPQDELNAILLAKAREGKRVVRLKGGDPYIFGRGGEEAEILADAGIPFEVIPGISSVHSVPGAAGIPVTHRGYNSSLTVITGHEAPSSPTNRHDWAHLAKFQGTLVVLMGLNHIREITAALLQHGRSADTPVAVISRGTTPHQRSIQGTLATIAELAEREKLSSPAVIVAGDAVTLRDKLNWFEHRLLFGQRIIVTQRADLAEPMVRTFREYGANVLEVPATRWVAHPEKAKLDDAIRNAQSYNWILFSNPEAVDHFFQRFLELRGDLRELSGIRLGAYGPRTGEKIRSWHVQPTAVAADHKTPLIMDAVTQCFPVRGQRFLIIRGDLALEKVPEALSAQGAIVDTVPGYAVKPESEDVTEDVPEMLKTGADWLVFASGLAIEHFHHRFDLPAFVKRFPRLKIAIATSTITWALDKFGLKAAVISRPNDCEDMAQRIAKS